MALPSARKTGSLFVALLAVFLLAGTALAGGGVNPPLVDFPVAPTFTPHSGGVRTQSDITSPAYPVYVTLCRQYDSRNTSPLLDGVNRAVTLTGAPCSINGGAVAVSLNITVFSIVGQTSNAVFKVGTSSPPTTAWINFAPGIGQIANAGSLPLSGAKQIFFQVAMGGGQLDFTIDVNAYYLDGHSSSAVTAGEFFGVYGNFGNGLLFSRNDSVSTGSSAIRGIMTNTTASTAGVLGEQQAATGVNYGVHGITSSTSDGAAAVYGSSDTPLGVHWFLNGTAAPGVYATSTGQWGILGLTSSSGGTARGVQGSRTDAAGNFQTSGVLGYLGTSGVFSFNDITKAGVVSFVEPHATDASKQILYAAIEGPEVGTYFRGIGHVQGGHANIIVPEHFRMVTEADGLSIQVTPIGDLATFAVEKIGLDGIQVRGSRNVDFFYTVNGIRKGYAGFQPMQDNIYIRPSGSEDRMMEYPDRIRQLLMANGVLKTDGTLNMETAARLGWVDQWRQEQEQAADRRAKLQSAHEGKRSNEPLP